MKKLEFKKVTEKKEPVTFEEALAAWERDLEPEFEANRRAETLSAEDFRILGNLRWKL